MNEVRVAAPYDFPLSLRVGRSFVETPEPEGAESAGPGGRDVLRMLTWPEGRSADPAAELVLLEIAQTAPDRIRFDASIPGAERSVHGAAALELLVARVVRAELDLEPFYDLLRTQGGFGWMAQELGGLKPLRPVGVYVMRGFGRWSADYILVRGLGRVDTVPADDLGIRTVVGQTLGGGERVSAEKVRELLLPFAPWRGLFAFYLLSAARGGLLAYHGEEVNRAKDQDET